MNGRFSATRMTGWGREPHFHLGSEPLCSNAAQRVSARSAVTWNLLQPKGDHHGRNPHRSHRGAWNKGKLVDQKAPFKLQEIWAIRIRLQMQGRLRELALFDLGIDSKLRACDLVKLRVRDVCHGDRLAARAIVLKQKTQRPVQFEITAPTREALDAWIKSAGLKSDSFLVSQSRARFAAPRHAAVRPDRA